VSALIASNAPCSHAPRDTQAAHALLAAKPPAANAAQVPNSRFGQVKGDEGDRRAEHGVERGGSVGARLNRGQQCVEVARPRRIRQVDAGLDAGGRQLIEPAIGDRFAD
jgi:hypothetical protein